jgi:hypothetical protein
VKICGSGFCSFSLSRVSFSVVLSSGSKHLPRKKQSRRTPKSGSRCPRSSLPARSAGQLLRTRSSCLTERISTNGSRGRTTRRRSGWSAMVRSSSIRKLGISRPSGVSRTTSFIWSGRFRKNITGSGQARGNSGLFLASTGPGDAGYELQILDSYQNTTYMNGMAASISISRRFRW